VNFGFQPALSSHFGTHPLSALAFCFSALPSSSFPNLPTCQPSNPQPAPCLTPFPATLTSQPQLPEKTATLSPAFATLTRRVKHKSFACHSYKKHPGWGLGPSRQMPFASRCWSWHSPVTSHQSQVTKSRRIRTYEKRAHNSFRIRTSKTRHLKSFRIRTYEKTGVGGLSVFQHGTSHRRLALHYCLHACDYDT